MAACRYAEMEDLITCSVCLQEFDNQLHCPKYLPCFHTLCMQCIQAMITNSFVTCPLCRVKFKCLDHTCFFTNNYALHLIDFKSSTASSNGSGFSNWCLNCGSLPKNTCPGSHRTIYIDSGQIHEAEKVQSLFNECTTMLADNVQKRQAIRRHLQSILKPLEMVENELRIQIERNDYQLAKMMSSLESIDLNNSKQGPQDLDKCLEQAREDKQDIVQISSKIEQDSKLFQGFEIKNSPCSTDELLMISHIIAHFQHKKKLDVLAGGSDSSSFSSESVNLTNTSQIFPPLPIATRLILRFTKNNMLFGQVEIHPSPSLNPSLFREIGIQYFQRPTLVGPTIKKAIKEKYLSLVIEDQHFQLSSPPYWSNDSVQHPFDVGITSKLEVKGKVQFWTLICFLSHPTEFPFKKPPLLFGRIFKGGDVISKLSHLNIQERADFNTIIESN